jgi:hypothetical protein
MQIAMTGMSAESITGRTSIEPQFCQSAFRLDFLTEPTVLMDLGLDLNKVDPVSKVRKDDTAFVIAYPHFNVNGVIQGWLRIWGHSYAACSSLLSSHPQENSMAEQRLLASTCAANSCRAVFSQV